MPSKTLWLPSWNDVSTRTFHNICSFHTQLMDLLSFKGKDLPCDDTFRYALKQMTVAELEQVLGGWSLEVSKSKEQSGWQAVSVDGKELLGSGAKYLTASFFHSAH